MAIEFMKKISPEYVLKKAIEDMKQTGLDGLKPYLTKETLDKIKKVQMLSDGMGVVSGIGMAGTTFQFSGSEIASVLVLLDKLSECDWTIIECSKGSSSAKGVLGFKYADIMDGTVDLTMITEEKEWKIDSLKMPFFKKYPTVIIGE